MILRVRASIYVVGVIAVVWVTGTPLILAQTAKNPRIAAGMLVAAVPLFLGMFGYFLWITRLTEVDISADVLTVKTPGKVHRFSLLQDIKKVVHAPGDGSAGAMEIHLENPHGKFVYHVGRYRPAAGNRMDEIVARVRAESERMKTQAATLARK